MRTWRGVKALLHDAVDATVELVREGQDSTARSVMRVTDEIEPIALPARWVEGVRRWYAGSVLGTIKAANRGVEALSNLGLAVAVPEPATEAAPIPLDSSIAGSKEWAGDATLGLVNAAVGDHLFKSGSELDLSMVFRVGERYAVPERDALRSALAEVTTGPKVALFVHGLGTTEWSWCLAAEAYHGDASSNFASMLARDLGFTPLFLRYNTGRHVSENGRHLADALEALAEAYPLPIEDLSLFGHSMGGLVASSACRYAEEQSLSWTRSLRRVFYLASPHQGAPMAKLGHALADALGNVDLPSTRVLARILEGRSAGIRDLRHGAIVDEEWLAPHPLSRDSLPLDHAAHYFVSASLTKDPSHPLGHLVGDLLVRVPSAAGPRMSEREFPIDTRHYGGVMHHQLQNHPAVYEQVRRACEEGA